MGNNFVNKMWKILGVENEDEYDQDEFEANDSPVDDRDFSLNTNNNKKVSIKSKQENGFLLSLQVNGIFDVTENAYDLVATEICNVVRRVIA